MSRPFQPLEQNKRFEQIVTLLKEKVLSGEYRPGDRLPTERELSEALHVSRLSVREAYRALQVLGMVEIRRGHQGGAFIQQPNRQGLVQSISDLFRFQGITVEEWTEARLIFETDIARLAIRRATPDDYARLEDAIVRTEEAARAGELAHAELIRFHLCLAEVARNTILYTSYRSMMDLLLSSFLALGVRADHYRNVSEEHRKILELLKAKDEAAFLRITEEHVQRAGKNLIRISRDSPLFHGNMA